MFSLLYGLVEYLMRKDEFHILILGIDKAGKTNVLERMKTLYTDALGLEPAKILPTVGLNVGRLEASGSKLVLWDLGGQPGLRAIWDKYYEETHALVYVVDASAPERFDESKLAMERVLGSQALHDAPLLILANKQDVPGAASAEQIADHFGVGRVDRRPVKVQPVCAHTGDGLLEGVAWVVATAKGSARSLRLRYRYS